jgi:glutathione S-transferase
MDMIRIHDFPRGARGLRPAWVCEELGLPYRWVPVSFPADDGYRALNPLGTVPLLEDGAVHMVESVAMMLYLAGRYGPTQLLPAPGDPGFARVLELAEFAEAGLGGCLNPLLAAHFVAPAEAKNNWSVIAQRERGVRFVAYLGKVLGNAGYLVGDTLTLADISAEVALRMWQGALDLPVPATLAAFRARMSAEGGLQRALAAREAVAA